jgi:hypothetical protein
MPQLKLPPGKYNEPRCEPQSQHRLVLRVRANTKSFGSDRRVEKRSSRRSPVDADRELVEAYGRSGPQRLQLVEAHRARHGTHAHGRERSMKKSASGLEVISGRDRI